MNPDILMGFVTFADSVTTIALLVLAVAGAIKGWWYSGEAYRTIKSERDNLLQIIFILMEIQEKSTKNQQTITDIIENKVGK